MKQTASVFKLAIFQFTPKKGDIRANWERLESAVNQVAGVDLLLLPELWATGPIDSSDTELFHKVPEILSRLKALAQEKEIFIVGTLPESVLEGPDRGPFNTTYVIGPNETLHTYRKIHLFAPMKEDLVFRPGSVPVSFWLSFRHAKVGIGLITCFDLRFPELTRYLVYQGVNLILLSALWPLSRKRHLHLLMRSRAIENQCFLAGANACGRVGDIDLAGGSAIIGPQGEVLAQATNGEEVLKVELDLNKIDSVRQDFLTAHPPRGWWPVTCSKILDLASLIDTVHKRRMAGQKMVFTNGCFDLLHAGHVSYLESARHLGDYLVVGLNSDRSVSRLKGPRRPINPEGMRAKVLAGLAAVDYVVIFDEPTPLRLIESIIPDILVKGADWAERDIVGAGVVKDAGGYVARIPFTFDISTSHILKKISARGVNL
jgi:rfaE bifunctional protein nucleotidyltransferase chain/domain